MATFYQPPPPFVGGRQPSSPHTGNIAAEAFVPPVANNPPFGHRGRTAVVLAGILAAWIVPDPLPTLPKKTVPPTLIIGPAQGPFSGEFSQDFGDGFWGFFKYPGLPGQSADPLPTLNRKLAQSGSPLVSQNSVGSPDWLSTVLSAWVPSDPVPTLGRKLTPPSVDAPPISGQTDAPFFSILSAWVPVDPPPTLGRKLTPPSVDNPAFGLSYASLQNRVAWTAPDPTPVLGEKLTPPSVDAPQTRAFNSQLWSTLTAWVQPDPLPTLTRKLTPPSVDNPPVNGGMLPDPQLINVIAAWVQPNPLPTLSVKLVQPQVIVAQQQGYTRPWLSGVLSAWQTPDPRPTLASKLSPSITAVRVDNPIFGLDYALLQNRVPWQTPDPIPAATVKLPQAAEVVAATYAPSPAPSSAAWDDPGVLPTLNRKLTPPSVDNPPVNGGMLPDPQLVNVIAAWQLVDPLPTLGRKLAQAQVQVTFQQGYVRPWLSTVLSAWVVADPLPTLSGKLPPQITAVPVNNPPFTNPARTAGLVASIGISWIPPDPQPTLTAKIVQPFIAPSTTIAFVRPWNAVNWFAWQPPDPLPTLSGKLNPTTTAVRVDNPPLIDFWLSGVLSAWTPQQPAFVQRTLIPQPGIAVQSKQPTAPSWLSSVLAGWQIPVSSPTLRPKLTPPSVDNPPRRAALQPVYTAWVSPDPLPTLNRQLIPPSVLVVNNPPFTQDYWLPTVLASWQPPFVLPVLGSPHLPPTGPFFPPPHRTTIGQHGSRVVLGTHGSRLVVGSRNPRKAT